MPENQDKSKPIEVTAKDLPLHCSMPDAPLWARHPRVFLDVGPRRQRQLPLLRRQVRVSPASCPKGITDSAGQLRPARGGNAPAATGPLRPGKITTVFRRRPMQAAGCLAPTHVLLPARSA